MLIVACINILLLCCFVRIIYGKFFFKKIRVFFFCIGRNFSYLASKVLAIIQVAIIDVYSNETGQTAVNKIFGTNSKFIKFYGRVSVSKLQSDRDLLRLGFTF